MSVPVGKSNAASSILPGSFACRRPPVQPARDHQVDSTSQQSPSSPMHDPLAEPAQLAHRAAVGSRSARRSTVRSTNGLARRTRSSGCPTMRALERAQIDGDVRQLGHDRIIAESAARESELFGIAEVRYLQSPPGVLTTPIQFVGSVHITLRGLTARTRLARSP